MKYAVIEAQNYELCGNHPSGLAITDGDADETVFISCVGKMFSTKIEARKAIVKYLKEVREIINQSGELVDGWTVEEDFDPNALILLHYEDDKISYGDWVIKCDVVEIPEKDDEIADYSCFLDFAKYWWQ